MSLIQAVARSLFDLIATIGRPVGGIRPRRIAHRLSQIGYGRRVPEPTDFNWYADRYGIWMKLHPYYLIDREVIAFGGYELPLQKYIEKSILPGMICLDVGANMGAVALHLAQRVGTTGRVYAFEPVPANAQRLREHVTRNGFDTILEVVQCALSDTEAELELLIADSSHVNQGMGSLVEVDHGDLKNKIKVQSLRLDGFCAANAIGKVDFIKVDIQGAEPLFLEGAKETLERQRPRIIMEVAPSSLSSSGYSSSDLLRRMEGIGYSANLLTASGDKGARLTADLCSATFTAESVLFEPTQAKQGIQQ